MLQDVFKLLVQELNEHFHGVESLPMDRVVLPDGSANELSFQLGAVTAMLINLEEERILRAAEPFVRRARIADEPAPERIHPQIRLSLYVLFVARFRQYEDSLLYLSRVIEYFRCHRVLDHDTTPGLDAAVEKLVPELVTLPFHEQNEVWSSLRTTYLPSALYKIKMVTFADDRGVPIPKVLETSTIVEPYGGGLAPGPPLIPPPPPTGD